MPTFKEFMRVANLTLKDHTSPKRMEEIVAIMRKHEVSKGLTPDKAVAILEDLGPTYVKIGQLASTRSDILPVAYCKAFEKLQAHVTPMDFATVTACLKEAYGVPWQEVFATFDETPLGSASIAQVHRATLKDGSEVAVKVRRPGIVEKMAQDITMMKHILAWAEFVVPSQEGMMLNLQSFVDELERTTADEVDFSIELQNLQRFHEEIKSQRGVNSPVPYPELSLESVLVMEYVSGFEVDKVEEVCAKAQGAQGHCTVEGEGASAKAATNSNPMDGKSENQSYFNLSGEKAVPTGIDLAVTLGNGASLSFKPTGELRLNYDASASKEQGFNFSLSPETADENTDEPLIISRGDDLQINREAIAQRLVRSYVSQVLDDGFFHADPHPGNIVIRGNEIVWIDLGMVGTLTASQRALVEDIFRAIAANNAYELKEAVVALSTAHGPVDQGLLLSQVSKILQQYSHADLSDINMGETLEEIIEVLRSQNLIVNPSVTTLARGVVSLEGVLAVIAPGTNVMKIVSDHVMAKETSEQSLKAMVYNTMAASAESVQAIARLPRQVSDTIDMLDKGEVKIVGDLRVPDNALATIYAVAGRLSLAIISIGLFLGSSILCTTAMEPKLLGVPVLGVAGFAGAFILSVYVIVRTLQSRHEMLNHKKLR